MIRNLIISLALALTIHAQAQPYIFRSLDARSGLPDNNVRAVTMLPPDGPVCILTSSCLAFYDGVTCKSFRWDPAKVPFAEYNGSSEINFDDASHRVLISSNDRAWAFDLRTGDFIYDDVPQPSVSSGESGTSRYKTLSDASGKEWMLLDKQVSCAGKVIEQIAASSDDLFTSMALDHEGRVWIGTARSGVRIYHPDGHMERLPYLETASGHRVYPHSDISDIYADPRGGVWISTQSEGILYRYEDIIRFRSVNNASLSSGHLADEGVKCLAESPSGKVLVGTIRGLYEYDPDQNAVRIPYRELADKLVISLTVDSHKRIWVGTFYDGLYLIDGGSVRHFVWDEPRSVEECYLLKLPNRNCVRRIFVDERSRIWVSVYGGIGLLDMDGGRISLLRDTHPDLARFMMIRDIASLPDGTLFVVGDSGRFCYDPDADRVIPLDSSVSYLPTNQNYLDSGKVVWTAGIDGLTTVNVAGEVAKVLDDGSIMAITEDSHGGIWVSSLNEVLKLNRMTLNGSAGTPATLRFSTVDGIDCGTFFQGSVLHHSDGSIYFGGTSGFCIVNPEKTYLRDDGIAPVVRSFKVNGEDRTFTEKLSWNENKLSFGFTNLNFANPGHSIYRYRLDGLEKEWRTLAAGDFPEADYSYLAPGKYTFLLSATSNGADWTEAAPIKFEVKPPFYASRLAKMLYILLGVLVLLLTYLYFYRRQVRRLKEKSLEERRRAEDELTQMKFAFFTNISHELRTPLSLILLPLESLMKEKEGTQEYARLDTMHRNTKSLMELVNHLLDFRKLELGGEKLNLTIGNLSEFAKGVVDTFSAAAIEKGVGLEYMSDAANPIASFDRSMMHKVLNNLLSNALKFTPAGGSVNVSLGDNGQGELVLRVSDTGIGIPADAKEHVFDKFYRSGNASEVTGSGIGLSLVKQYVDMHSGSISVESEEGKGSTFTVTLPSGVVPAPVEETPREVPQEEKKRILVVDDNADFRQYLREELSPLYCITVAVDGVDALEKIKAARPDVVVSDVMMPRMNGFDLTKEIKEDLETSHIPVILLTARLSDDVRTEGYQYGADSYITKPFRMEMLLVRIKNLLDEREKRVRSFSTKADVSPMHVTITTVDQKLMARIMEYLEKNMDNTEYSVEQLAYDVGMHRMNLYRKIQSLYGMTPSEFIRTMRLKRAAQLITDDPNLNINEVADMVGFNTPKYFSKYFKELFGVLPSQYNKK